MEFNFHQVFHECILDVLRNVIGESGTKAVLFRSELDRYVEDPGKFHEDLYAIFKDGVFSLEKSIVKELFQRLNLTYEEENSFDFARDVSQARELLLKNRRRRSRKASSMQPQLKIIRTVWPNSSTQVSFVVVDLSMSSEYPQNFVCLFPKNLFRRNQKGNLRESKFFQIFGEKTYEMAEHLLEDALKRETEPKTKAEIGAMLTKLRKSADRNV